MTGSSLIAISFYGWRVRPRETYLISYTHHSQLPGTKIGPTEEYIVPEGMEKLSVNGEMSGFDCGMSSFSLPKERTKR